MPKESQGQSIWFGVAMFLMGLIAGVVVTFASGAGPRKTTPVAPNPPTAQPAPPAPRPVGERMTAYAAELGVDTDAFKGCIAKTDYTAKINRQMAEGQAAGVSGTPGNIIYDMKSKKGIVISGAQPFSAFQNVVDVMLKNPADAFAMPGVQLAGPVTHVDLENDHVRGDTGAEIAIIEYSDYQCPYCHRVHPTYVQLLDQYDGKIMWVYRHFPLNFHPEAMPLAIGAECVNELSGNDAFWEFSDKVMAE